MYSYINEFDLERFWSFIIKTELCWRWIGTTDDNNYGIFWLRDKNVRAHRLSYDLANKFLLEDGQFVCHSCNNSNCTNPKHLYLASAGENVKHAHRDGLIKHLIGEANHLAKLKESDIVEIKKKLLKWEDT